VDQGPFRLGEWLVEPRLNRLTRDGKSVQIELKMMEVLLCLAKHAGELVERQQLIDQVWATEFISENILTRAIAELRRALGDDAKYSTFIETIHGRGYRLLQEPVPREDTPGALFSRSPVNQKPKDSPASPNGQRRWLRVGLVVSAIAVFAIVIGLWQLRGRTVLNETDTILVTDFVNRTDDPIFEGTLKQALALKLGESPFLNVISENRVRGTLHLMGRDPDEHISPDLGREICQRLNLKAIIAGEIAPLGSHYVLTLNTVECRSGDSLALEQAEASAKEDLLVALDQATAGLRRKLGESLRSIEEYDTPLATAATPSLEALKSYSIARSLGLRGRSLEARPHALRAIELDPTFARAYSHLAIHSWNRGDREEARKWITEAFTHRDRATETYRFWIDAFYYKYATGEYDKAIEANRLKNDLYPGVPTFNNMANLYHELGQFDRALDLRLDCLDVLPDRATSYQGLARTYLALNQLESAKQIVAAGFAEGFDGVKMRIRLYHIAFLTGDPKTIEAQLQWSSGGPYEGEILREHSLASAFGGKLRESNDFARRSHEVAERFDSWAAYSSTLALLALAEAQSGLSESATEDAEAAAAVARNPVTTVIAALALARAGEIWLAGAFADGLARSWPLDTLVNSIHMPAIRAEIALSTGDPQRAIEHLRTNLPHENHWCDVIDMRGRALLASGSAPEAAAEFERLLKLRGVWPVHPRYATAHLWLGRARAATGDTDTAIGSYETFLHLWKDADPDIPLLLEAQTEYGQLIITPD